MKKSRGVLVTFEGGEGCGKTTLIEALAETLSREGWPVCKTFEPGATPLGSEIRRLLLSKEHNPSSLAELFLFLADRAEHVSKVVLPALSRGEIVLSDRFFDSTLAYQGTGRGLTLPEVRSLCLFSTQGVVPDLTFYLDLDPRIGLARAKQVGSPDRLEAEKISFHEKIRGSFLEMAKEEPSRFRVLRADLPKEEVLAQALALCKKIIPFTE